MLTRKIRDLERNIKSRALRCLMLASASTVALLGVSPVLANPLPDEIVDDQTPKLEGPETTSAADSNEESALDIADIADIVVTGSRISRSGFSAPTPTTVLGMEDMERAAVTNVADLLNQLPSFRKSASTTVGTLFPNAGGNYLDLRGLGIVRTLTLVNGARHVPTNKTGQVDINLIPSLMIERTEVVTGGASAAYGSDAVAGVVNLIYKRNVQGFEGNVQYGISSRGDNKELALELLYGTSFAGGRGHFMLAGQYVDNDGIGILRERPWGRHDRGVIPNPAATPANGLPMRIHVENVRNTAVTPGGVINAPPFLRGTQFVTGGQAVPFNFGEIVGPSFMSGGDGYFGASTTTIETPNERQSVSAFATYDLTSSIELNAAFSYARSEANSTGGNIQDRALTVSTDNPYLPASIRDTLIANGLDSLTIGRRSLDFHPDPSVSWLVTNSVTEAYRGVIGLKGSFGSSWKWDAYYQLGRSSFLATQSNRIQANWLRAIDAVTDPGTGAIVCRASLSPDPAVRAAAAGCVPYNILGSHSRSVEAARYVSGTTVDDQSFSQDVISASIQGEPFSTWAGPVSVAFGGENRREHTNSTVDLISAATGFSVANPVALRGTSKVTEGFAETVIPLAKDVPFAKLLELNAAARYTHYSLSGNVTTWKLGLTYSPIDDVRFRFTRSRDIRAPNLNELFTGDVETLTQVFDPVKNTFRATSVITGGNRDLKPEKADTLTVGVVFQPSFIPNFRASIDAYDIKLKGAISQLAFGDIVARCAAGNMALCSRVTRDAAGELQSVKAVFENIAKIHTRGIDFEVDYRLPLNRISENWDGDLSFHLLATYVDKMIIDDGNTALDLAGDVGGLRPGGVPRWSGLGVISYRNGPLDLSTQIKYVGGGTYDATARTPQDIDDNHVPSRTYVQLSGSYELLSGAAGRRLQLFAVVDNLFDVDPPIAPSLNFFPTNAVLFDTIGRTFRMGARFKF